LRATFIQAWNTNLSWNIELQDAFTVKPCGNLAGTYTSGCFETVLEYKQLDPGNE
jgi:hypothetical protein